MAEVVNPEREQLSKADRAGEISLLYHKLCEKMANDRAVEREPFLTRLFGFFKGTHSLLTLIDGEPDEPLYAHCEVEDMLLRDRLRAEHEHLTLWGPLDDDLLERVKARLDLPEQDRARRSTESSSEVQHVRGRDLEASKVDKQQPAASHRRHKGNKKTRDARDELRVAALKRAAGVKKAAAGAREAAAHLDTEVTEAKHELQDALFKKALVASQATQGNHRNMAYLNKEGDMIKAKRELCEAALEHVKAIQKAEEATAHDAATQIKSGSAAA